MKRILLVGGAGGIGLAIARQMVLKPSCEKVYIVDKQPLDQSYANPKVESFIFDLGNEDYSFFDRFQDIDSLMITAGFGKLSLFREVPEEYIIDSFNVNSVAPIRISRRFADRLHGKETFRCGVMVSIAGFMSSPFFAVYGATKAALKIFIESFNVELEKQGSSNRVLNVSPGSIRGTGFGGGGKTDLNPIAPLAEEIIDHLQSGDDLFIPQYEEIYKTVLKRYHDDFREEGRHSYDYKLDSGRLSQKAKE